MITVNDRVVERLKKELLDTCYELGGEFITIMTGENGRKSRVNDSLIERCSEFGLGFRLMGGSDDDGRTSFNIKLDNKDIGDEVINASGLKIFLDPVSAIHLKDYELDYFESYPGFFLKGKRVIAAVPAGGK